MNINIIIIIQKMILMIIKNIMIIKMLFKQVVHFLLFKNYFYLFILLYKITVNAYI